MSGDPKAKVVDLMAALEQSVARAKADRLAARSVAPSVPVGEPADGDER